MAEFGALYFETNENGLKYVEVCKFERETIFGFRYKETLTAADFGNGFDLIKWIVKLGIKNVLVWDGNLFGMILDAYAAKNNIPEYVKSDNRYSIQQTPAIARTDTESAILERKIWLKVDSKHAGKEVLKSTVFTNFSSMFPSLNYEQACKSLIKNEALFGYESTRLFSLIRKFHNLIKELTQLEYITEKRINFLTVGSLSKAYYFKLKYKNEIKISPSKFYKSQHPLDEDLEIKLREYKLLNGGILYARNGCYKRCSKYDINSLYPSVYKTIGHFTKPEKCFYDEALKTLQLEFYPVEYEYIFVLKEARLMLKNGALPIWHSLDEPYKNATNNDKIIIINNWAVFGGLLRELMYFYDIELEIEEVYKMQRYTDRAIHEYVEGLYAAKARAREERNEGKATIVKFLLNNLHGKFAQLPYYGKKLYYLNEETGIVNRKTTKIEKNGDSFDFIRGAYIYARANIEMLRRIRTQRRIEDIIYVDTDCIIFKDGAVLRGTTHNTELGFFKIEGFFEQVYIVQSKIYFLQPEQSVILPVCAGHNKTEIIEFLAVKENFGLLRFEEIIEELIKKDIPTKILHRTPYGGAYEYVDRPLISDITTDIILEEEDAL